MKEHIQPFVAYDDSFSLDDAAELLGCQQKKIMAEWAKGNIRVVLDFGPEEKVDPSMWGELDRYGRSISPWCLANVSAPATEAYFPDDLLNPRFGSHYILKDRVQQINPTFYRVYGQSGFYYSSRNSNSEKEGSEATTTNLMTVRDILLFGYWVVPYGEFLRLHVQSRFTLKPFSNAPKESAVTATFMPGEGSRRINAPDKKNLRITASEIKAMRDLLAKQQKRQTTAPIESVTTESHGNIERFALERERVLAAALYVSYNYKPEIGKSFKSHAECIYKYRYLFWPDRAAPEPERLAKILSDAAKRPEEWKILGGNAKPK